MSVLRDLLSPSLPLLYNNNPVFYQYTSKYSLLSLDLKQPTRAVIWQYFFNRNKSQVKHAK